MSIYPYPRSSPYASTPQTSFAIGIYRHRPIPSHIDDREITISSKYVNRPDLLSYDLYGSPEYWWIFAVRNPNIIRDSIWDLVLDTKVMVPSDEYLRRVIG